MEKLLEKYLMKVYNYDKIYIGDYTVDRASCVVTYYTDSSKYYKEVDIVNIWFMLSFVVEMQSEKLI